MTSNTKPFVSQSSMFQLFIYPIWRCDSSFVISFKPPTGRIVLWSIVQLPPTFDQLAVWEITGWIPRRGNVNERILQKYPIIVVGVFFHSSKWFSSAKVVDVSNSISIFLVELSSWVSRWDCFEMDPWTKSTIATHLPILWNVEGLLRQIYLKAGPQ